MAEVAAASIVPTAGAVGAVSAPSMAAPAVEHEGQSGGRVAEAVKAVFRECDANGDGVVSCTELRSALRQLAGWHDGELEKLFTAADVNSDGVLDYSEFIDWVFKTATHGAHAEVRLPESPYLERHQIGAVFEAMAVGLAAQQPEDPYLWMIRHLVALQRHSRGGAMAGAAPAAAGVAGPSAAASAATASAPASAVGDEPSVAARRGRAVKRRRVNTSACVRKSVKPLLDLILAEEGWEQVEDSADTNSVIYVVWDARALLSRLGHPAGKQRVPRLPASAAICRMPGMGCLCDKVNMALALRLLQALWPAKFSFWPKSWLLPAETEELRHYLRTHRSATVIVKPEGGSMGEGIFLAQSPGDLDAKLAAKPHWGATFGALAQRYVPSPLLLDGLKFDLRLYVVVTSIDPLCAYLCKEGLARFCTAKYEEPSAANSSQHYMHLTNYSVNKRSTGYVKSEDPLDVNSQATKRPLSTLLAQIAAREAMAGRRFSEDAFFASLEEVVVVFLQAIAPVLSVTYDRVVAEAKPKKKAKPKAKAQVSRPRVSLTVSDDESESEESEDVDSSDSDEGFAPSCFQMLGVDVLLDEKLQPWLLEVNARPSMEIDGPVRLAEAPPGMRRCACRDMDGEEHVHLRSEVDARVKRVAMGGAFELALHEGRGPLPPGYFELDFARHSPSEAQETLQAIARIYQAAGGQKKAFTTSGLRRALAGAVAAGTSLHDMDTVVTRWKFQGYRHDGNLEEDGADIGVLDFAALLRELALLPARRAGGAQSDEDALDALTELIDQCDPG